MGKSKYRKSKNSNSNTVAKTPEESSVKQQTVVDDVVERLLILTSQPFDEKVKWTMHLAIEQLLQEMQKLEPVFDITRDREEHFPSLMTWIKENGGITKNVTIKKYDEMGYGLEALKDLKQDELVCTVPRKVMMTIENIKKSPLNYLYENDFILKNMGNIALAIFLIFEFVKGKKSFWYPYIYSLPLKYNTVLYFTTDDFLELKCSPTFDPAIKHYRNVARQYAYFKSLFLSSKDEASLILRNHFSYQLYRWAVSNVMTRDNKLPAKDNGFMQVDGFVPLWDMCNHTNGYLSTQCKRDRIECFACQSFKKGDQVFTFYGKRSNQHFFLHNGFVYEENEFDSFPLLLKISKLDKLYDLKAELLKSIGIPVSGNFHLYLGDEPVRNILLAYLRIFNMDADELNRWKMSDHPKKLFWKDCPLIDASLDAKVWNFLFNRIKLVLTTYGQIEVNDPELSETRRLVRSKLALEKKFLESVMESVRQKIEP